MAAPRHQWQPPSWVAERAAWITRMTPAPAADPETEGRVFTFNGMTPTSAAAMLERLRRVDDMKVQAVSGLPPSMLLGLEPIPEQAPVVGPEGIWPAMPAPAPSPATPPEYPVGPEEIWPQPSGTTPGPNSGAPQAAPNSSTEDQAAAQPARTQPDTALPEPGTDNPDLPNVGSVLDLLAMGKGPALKPGQSRTLPSGITITVNPDQTKSVTRIDQQTGAIHTDVYNKHGIVISAAVSTEVPGTAGMSRDTTITDSRGLTSMRSVSNGRGGYTTWTANPDGTHSVQYPDHQIFKELDGKTIEVAQLDPDGLGGHSTGITPDGSTYSSAFRTGPDGILETALATADGTEVAIATIPGHTNGEPLSIVTRSDRSRFVLYPDGTQVPIDRYNNAIGGPNYANQFDPLTATWRSDPYHRRGPILMNADGTSYQEWFALDENGKEFSSTARFDAEGNITRLETLDYLGLRITEFDTKDGITTPLTTNFLDSGHVEDQSALVLETTFMFVGIPSLGLNIGRQIGNRLIATQLTRQGVSKANIALTLNQLGGPGSTAFLAASSAARRPALTLPATQVYAPTGMWDATIALGQKTEAGIRAGRELTGALYTETSVALRTTSTRISDFLNVGNPSRLTVGEYLDRQYVREALDRASAAGKPTKIGLRELSTGDAVRFLLPTNQKALEAIQMNTTLESFLLKSPETLVSLLKHPKAVDILHDTVYGLRHGIRYTSKNTSEMLKSTRLTDSQLAVSSRAKATAETNLAGAPTPRQPGFDLQRATDPEYVGKFVDEMYDKWDDAQRFLDDLTKTLERRVGGVSKGRELPKSRARVDEKLVEYKNDAARLVDLAGSKITFERVDDIYRALDDIERSGLKILRVKDRFIDPASSGYRDILMNVQAPNGLVVELRLHLKSIDKVSDKFDHALYEISRGLKINTGSPHDEIPSLAGQAIIDGLSQRANDIFIQALMKGMPKL